jgi:hypothetical protein
MALEHDYPAERLARIERLMSDARHALTLAPDKNRRKDLCTRLDATLRELGVSTALALASRRSHN